MKVFPGNLEEESMTKIIPEIRVIKLEEKIVIINDLEVVREKVEREIIQESLEDLKMFLEELF